MNDKPTYTYEAAFGVRREVELMIKTFMNDNIYIGLKGPKLDDGNHHFVDLTVNIPSAPTLEPFRAAIDIENLGQLDVMNFLSENGLAKHTGKHLPRGHIAFPVFEFDPEKLAEADPKGFKYYLKVLGLDEKQIKESSVKDLASMAKAHVGMLKRLPTKSNIQGEITMSIDKPCYTYESVYGGKQEVLLHVSAYTMSDNIYVGLNAVEPDGGTYHYADLTVNIPSASPLEPFRAAIDIEHLGQLDAMNFLLGSGLAKQTGQHLPSGFMVFPVFDFDPGKLAEADPKGFKDYLKIVGLDEKQIGENSVEDLASMAKARFFEKAAAEKEPTFQFGEELVLPFGEGSLTGSFEQVLEALRDDDLLEDDGGEFTEPTASETGFAGFDLDGFLRYCEKEGIAPDDIERREDPDSLEDAKRQAKDSASEKNADRSERSPSKPSPDMEL